MICEHFTNQTLKTTVHEYTHQMQTYCERKKLWDGTLKAIHVYHLIATIIHGCWVLKILKTSKWHFFPPLKLLMLVNLNKILPEYSFFGHLFLLKTC